MLRAVSIGIDDRWKLLVPFSLFFQVYRNQLFLSSSSYMHLSLFMEVHDVRYRCDHVYLRI